MKTLFARTLIVITLSFLSINTVFSQVPEAERDALIALYNSTNGANWLNHTNWNTSTDVYYWHGVQVTDNHVTAIMLIANNLTGTFSIGSGNLPELEYLHLDANQMSGSIPPEIGNLTNAISIDLSGNLLSGAIPAEFGNLINLTDLFLQVNNLTSIPSELGNMASLEILWLYRNDLTGSIPTGLGSLSNLLELQLWRNDLTGSIPSDLGNLANLTYLSFYENHLNGSIPSELGNLSNLEHLNLRDNQLSGSIPAEFGNMSNLRFLSLSRNHLTGAIPSELGNLSNLERFLIDENLLTGNFPPDFANQLNLEYIWIQQNLIYELPDLSNLINLTSIQIQDNNFTFEDIEPNIGITDIVYNPQSDIPVPNEVTITPGGNLELSVPVGGSANEYQWFKDWEEIVGATSYDLLIENVTEEDQGYYSLRITSTVITDLELWTEDIEVMMVVLVLGVEEEEYEYILELFVQTDGDNWENNENWDSDELVEDWYGVIVEDEHIIGLLLESNLLNGELPSEIGVLDSLQNLDLSGNLLGGPLPYELGDLSVLEEMILDSNLFNGSIPESFGNLSLLETLLLNSNELDGIPNLLGKGETPFLDGLDNLTDFQVQDNNLEFDDLEPNVEITGIVYAPQAQIPGPEPITLTEGEELNITIPVGGSANEYQWFRDGVEIDGATSDNLVVASVSTADIGTYYLRITNPAVPLLTLYSDDILVDIITGIRDESLNNAFKIYPVPVRDQLNIETGDMPAGEYDLRIIDLSGKTMYNEQLLINNSKEVQQLDVNTLPSGIYMVMMHYADGVFVQKVVKE